MTDLIAAYTRYLHRDLGRAPATVNTYLGVLRRIDRTLPYGLAAAHTDELRDEVYAAGLAPATRSLYRAVVRGFFAWATDPDEPRLDYNSARRLPPVRLPLRAPRVIPTARLHDILDGAGRPCRVWFLLAAYAGLRCCEIAALDRADVTEVEVWVQGKGDRERVVPCHPLVWDVLKRQPAGPVAAGLDRRQVSQRGNHHLTRIGHPDVTMHDLRRWFGTAAYEATGGDIRVAQELLGHSSVATTQRYVATREGRKRSAVAGLPVVA